MKNIAAVIVALVIAGITLGLTGCADTTLGHYTGDVVVTSNMVASKGRCVVEVISTDGATGVSLVLQMGTCQKIQVGDTVTMQDGVIQAPSN